MRHWNDPHPGALYGVTIPSFGISQVPEKLNTRKDWDMRFWDAMDASRKARERAERLRLIRERLHKIRSQRQFAAQLGVPYNTYNNWERGSPIPESWAERLKRITPGITGDWLFWGDESKLDVDTLQKLKAKCSNS